MDELLHSVARARSLDNLSIVFVAFQRFKDYIEMFKQEISAQVGNNPMPMQVSLSHMTAHENDLKKNTTMGGVSVASLDGITKTPQRMSQSRKQLPGNSANSGQTSFLKTDEIAKENSLPKMTGHLSTTTPGDSIKALQKNS